MSARTLRAEAHEACRNRGHDMKRFNHVIRRAALVGRHPTGWRSWCKHCGAEVDVLCNPAPNETNISGLAVSTNCPDEPLFVVTSEPVLRLPYKRQPRGVLSFGPFPDTWALLSWAEYQDADTREPSPVPGAFAVPVPRTNGLVVWVVRHPVGKFIEVTP